MWYDARNQNKPGTDWVFFNLEAVKIDHFKLPSNSNVTMIKDILALTSTFYLKTTVIIA